MTSHNLLESGQVRSIRKMTQTPIGAFLVNQTLEERRISVKAVVYKKNEPDMSASPQLKQRMRTKPSNKMVMMEVNKNQVSQGNVNIIAKKPAIQHNTTTLFRQISGETEVFNTHTGPEMALQLGRAARPMAEQRLDHVMRKKAAEPIKNQTPEPTENHVGGSHL